MRRKVKVSVCCCVLCYHHFLGPKSPCSHALQFVFFVGAPYTKEVNERAKNVVGITVVKMMHLFLQYDRT